MDSLTAIAEPAPEVKAPAPPTAPAAEAPAPPAAEAPASVAKKLFTFEQMRVKVGDRFTLELPGAVAGSRSSITVLGWLTGQSLMVTAPHNSAGRLALQQGELVLLRAFTGKSAFAFRAHVQQTAHLPFQYIHLSFPDKVEGLDIRNSPRCRVELPASFGAAGVAPAKGNILNIGTTGALFETDAAFEQGEGVVQVAFSFEILGVPISLDLGAKVRDKKNIAAPDAAPRYQYGVQFSNLQPNDRLMLGSLVWHELYEHPQNLA